MTKIQGKTTLKDLLFLAFQGGNYRVNNEQPKQSVRDRFEEWYDKDQRNHQKGGDDESK